MTDRQTGIWVRQRRIRMRKEEEDIGGNVTKNVPVYQNSKGRAGYC